MYNLKDNLKSTFTISDLKNSQVASRNKHLFETPQDPCGKPQSKVRRDCKQVVWMKEQLAAWCHKNDCQLLTEHKFNEYRKFRFDFAIVNLSISTPLKIAIEYEGLNSKKSGHTTLLGYTSNTDKYNLAQSEGWIVLRFTVLNYQNVIKELEKFNE